MVDYCTFRVVLGHGCNVCFVRLGMVVTLRLGPVVESYRVRGRWWEGDQLYSTFQSLRRLVGQTWLLLSHLLSGYTLRYTKDRFSSQCFYFPFVRRGSLHVPRDLLREVVGIVRL